MLDVTKFALAKRIYCYSTGKLHLCNLSSIVSNSGSNRVPRGAGTFSGKVSFHFCLLVCLFVSLFFFVYVHILVLLDLLNISESRALI